MTLACRTRVTTGWRVVKPVCRDHPQQWQKVVFVDGLRYIDNELMRDHGRLYSEAVILHLFDCSHSVPIWNPKLPVSSILTSYFRLLLVKFHETLYEASGKPVDEKQRNSFRSICISHHERRAQISWNFAWSIWETCRWKAAKCVLIHLHFSSWSAQFLWNLVWRSRAPIG